MWNHLMRLLKTDSRYKWLLINMVFGTFFIIAPYIYMVSEEQQVLTLKGMLCWYGLNQSFFTIGAFVTEERLDGTFTNLFLYPIQFQQYFLAKALQMIIETYAISLLQIFFFSLIGIHIPDLFRFLFILFINEIVVANMGILFLCLSMHLKKLGSLNSLVQQIIGFFSGYSYDIKKYPRVLQFVSYVIPLTYTIAFARSDIFSMELYWLLLPLGISFLFALIGYSRVNHDIQILRKNGDTDQW